MFCLVILAMASLALSRQSHAEPVRLRLSEYQKQNWQVEDGLSESYIRQIAQAPDGKLLLATFSGVLTFDGQRFSRVGGVQNTAGVNGAAVNAILPGRHGDLWVGTDGSGVLHQTPAGVQNVSQAAGLLQERIRTMKLDRHGVLWVATQNGVEHMQDGRLQRLPGNSGTVAGDLIAVFAESAAGRPEEMLFLTSRGLFRWDGTQAQRLPLPAAYGTPTAIFRDPHGTLWIGTESDLLMATDEPAGAPPVVRSVGKTETPVTAFASDADGDLWLGTRHSGIFRYSTAAGGQAQLDHWGPKDGFEDDNVRSLFVDDEKNLWIGMLTGGLSRWRRAAFAPYGRQEGLAIDYAGAVLSDSRGDLWFGTWGQGLFRKHGEKTLPVALPGAKLSTPIRAITEGQPGEIWVGTWFDGLYRVTDKGAAHFRLGIESPVNAISSIIFARDNSLWIGTYTGVFHFASGRPGRGPSVHLLPNKLITCMVEQNDGTLLAGTSEGLFRIRGDHVESIQSLPNPYVLSLTRDIAGNVWAGFRSGGVGLVDGMSIRPLQGSGYLASLPVYSGVEDLDGHMWLGTSRGVLRVARQEMEREAHGGGRVRDVVLFGKSDGMRSSDCSGMSQPSATRTKSGALWFATSRGYAHTTEVAEEGGLRLAAPSLIGWSGSSNEDDAVLPASGIELSPEQQEFHVFFNARNLSNPGQLEFRYKLENYDTDWTTTHGRVALYRRLPYGHYQFLVQVRKSGMEWASPVTSIAVYQRPYFYNTWWFVLLCLLLLGGLAFLWYRQRMRRMRAELAIIVEERNRIARECHDTLMAGFAAVAWQLESTSRFLADDKEASAAARSCELAHSMVLHCQAEARRIIWDLRDSGELSNVLSYALSRAIETHYRQHEVEVSLHTEGQEFILPPGSVHHLVCIAQEAISNALRHASPQRIEVRLLFSGSDLRMEIRDDGHGFSTTKTQKIGHFGLIVMEERARKLGGEIYIHSAPRHGTSVTVCVPFFNSGVVESAQQSSLQAAMW